MKNLKIKHKAGESVMLPENIESKVLVPLLMTMLSDDQALLIFKVLWKKQKSRFHSERLNAMRFDFNIT